MFYFQKHWLKLCINFKILVTYKYLLIEPIWVLKRGLGHGYGVYTWPEGSQYEGNWANGKQHGKGLFINDKGIEQVGIWENGKHHGFFVKVMQNSKSKFLHDPIYCQIRQSDVYYNEEEYSISILESSTKTFSFNLSCSFSGKTNMTYLLGKLI